VAESFFSSLKREGIRRRTYKSRKEARQDVFDFIEIFYNSTHGASRSRTGCCCPLSSNDSRFWKRKAS